MSHYYVEDIYGGVGSYGDADVAEVAGDIDSDDAQEFFDKIFEKNAIEGGDSYGDEFEHYDVDGDAFGGADTDEDAESISNAFGGAGDATENADEDVDADAASPYVLTQREDVAEVQKIMHEMLRKL